MMLKALLGLCILTTAYCGSCPAVKQGCFKHDNKVEHRLHSDRQEHEEEKFHSGTTIDWNNFEGYLKGAICRCEKAAVMKDYAYFSLRNFGECYGIKHLKGMVKSEYCFHHSYEQCKKNHDKCTGAEEGEYVYQVKIKKPNNNQVIERTRVFCEHRGAHQVACPANYRIEVESAYYGRKSTKHCGFGKHYNTKCVARHSTQMIRNECNGRRTCRMNPSNGVYGDPCKYTVKYIEMKYKCVPVPSKDPGAKRVRKVHFCEHRGAKVIKCGKGKKIKVRSGFYGRLAKICGSSHRFQYNCVSDSSQQKIKSACDGKNSCRLNPSNGVYGDPCKYTVKYLEVQYSCVIAA